MAVRPHWQPARVLVDSGSEHAPLISQDLEDRMGMTGVRAGGATQADGACLPLFDIGCLVSHYVHNDLWQWAEAGLQQLTFSKPRPPGERRAVWAWAETSGQEGAVGSAAKALPSSS